MESEYIQLPPLPLDMPTECIELLWKFVHLPKQEQKKVREFLAESLKEDGADIKKTEFIKTVQSSEEVNPDVQDFFDSMREFVGGMVAQSCEMAALLYQNYCVDKKSIEEISKELQINKKSLERITQYYDKQ